LSARPAPSCYDKAVELLARRPHFERELSRKLEARGFPSSAIEETLARLRRHGYVDDHAAAKSFVAQRLARGGLGRARLLAELRARGVTHETAVEILDSALPEDDLELARQVARRWRRRGGSDPRALARHLTRKGFSSASISRLLGEIEM